MLVGRQVIQGSHASWYWKVPEKIWNFGAVIVGTLVVCCSVSLIKSLPLSLYVRVCLFAYESVCVSDSPRWGRWRLKSLHCRRRKRIWTLLCCRLKLRPTAASRFYALFNTLHRQNVIITGDVNEASKVRGQDRGQIPQVPGQGQKKLRGLGRTLWGRGQRCINCKLLIWIQLKEYCSRSHDSVKW